MQYLNPFDFYNLQNRYLCNSYPAAFRKSYFFWVGWLINPLRFQIDATVDKNIATLNVPYTQGNLSWLNNTLNKQVHIKSIKCVQYKALFPEYLSILWQIPSYIAKRSLETITQDSIRYKDATCNMY